MEDAGFVWAAALAVVATFAVAGFFARKMGRGKWAPAFANGRNAALDGLRGYLALAVLCHHFLIWIGVTRFGRGWTAPGFFPFDHLGLGAVVLFFMITGFVFAPWIARGDISDWPRMALRRFFRLQPLVILSVALVAALCFFSRGGSLETRDIRAALLWLSCWKEPDLFGVHDTGRINAYVLWSLKFEWLFTFFLLPLCALLRKVLRGRAPGWVAPGGLLLLVAGCNFVLPGDGAAAAIARLAAPFLIGMIVHEALAHERMRAAFAAPWATALGALALGFASARAPTPFSLSQMALYSLLFCCVAARRDLAALTGAGAQALGGWSYPIYLFHGIFLSLLFVEGGGFDARASALLALLPALACVVVAASALAHVAIERPATAFGKKLMARGPARRAKIAPAPL